MSLHMYKRTELLALVKLTLMPDDMFDCHLLHCRRRNHSSGMV